MKLLCLFDLPMVEKKDIRAYSIFRKKLIKEGFIMMQFSVYVKPCANREATEAASKKIRKICPKNGNVRLLCITEKQYDDIEIIVGSKNLRERMGTGQGLIII